MKAVLIAAYGEPTTIVNLSTGEHLLWFGKKVDLNVWLYGGFEREGTDSVSAGSFMPSDALAKAEAARKHKAKDAAEGLK